MREKEQEEGTEPETDRGKSPGRRDRHQVQVQDGDDIEKDEIPETEGARKLGMRRLAAFFGRDHGGGFYNIPERSRMRSECDMVFRNDGNPDRGMMGSSIDAATLVRASLQQAHCDVHGEIVILDVERGAYYGLEEVGARVWELLQTPRRVFEVRDILVAEFDVSAEKCEQDLTSFLGELLDAGLAECEPSHVAKTHPDPAG